AALFIGSCPLPTPQGPCGGRLQVRPGQVAVACPGCRTCATVEEWHDKIMADATIVVDAYAAAARLSTLYRREVPVDTVRKWGHRRKIDTFPTRVTQPWRAQATTAPARDRQGRVLYDWNSVLTRAHASWGQPG